MSNRETAFLNLDSFANTIDVNFFVGMKVYCRSPCQLLIALGNEWINWGTGELAFLESNFVAYICFLNVESPKTIQIRNGCEWSRPHSNLLMILDDTNLIAFNFPIGYEKNCAKIESYLLNRNEPMKIVHKIIDKVRNFDSKIRDGAEKLGSCVTASASSDDENYEIGLPESFRHLATLRLEKGWLTARCTDDADSNTLGVIAAAGLEPERTPKSSIE